MKLAITLISALAMSSVAGVAHADKKEKADALFKQGKKLMGEKRYADACQAFEDSYKLDPGIGAQLNVAKCFEEWGKIGRAYIAYQQAEKLAKDANDRRVNQIHELVEGLDTQVPRLTIKLPKNAPKEIKVTLDMKVVTNIGEPIVVDPGPHTIEYSVGDQKKQKVVPMDRGAENEVTLEIPKAMMEAAAKTGGGGGTKTDPNAGQDDKKPGKAADKPVPGRSMRIGGIALAGAGVLGIGISSVMTLSARGKYNDALDMYCNGMTNGCDAMGLSITHDARSTANTATVIFLVGTAAVAGGVVLYLLAPKANAAPDESEDEQASSRYLVPSITSTGAGLVYGGHY